MKGYKSINAYNFSVSGWVNTLCIRSVDADKVVVFTRVGKFFFRSLSDRSQTSQSKTKVSFFYQPQIMLLF